MSKPWILGLTGGIGSGKSAVAQHFIDLGIHLVDADHAARWVVEPGRPALAKIAERFGPQVLQADGSLDRTVLRQLVFQDEAQRRWLAEASVGKGQGFLFARAVPSDVFEQRHLSGAGNNAKV